MMLRRLFHLYQRYLTHNFVHRPGGREIRDADGRLIGAVDHVEWRRTRLLVSGWAKGTSVTLADAAGSFQPQTTILEPNSEAGKPPFSFELLADAVRVIPTLNLREGKRRVTVDIPRLTRTSIRVRQLLYVFPFGVALTRAMPSLVAWFRRRDPQAKARIKELLGLVDTHGLARGLPPGLFAAADTQTADDAPITIIVPVYNAFDLLPELLDRVLRNTDLPWHLLLVEDCSSDDRVRPFLQDWTNSANAETPGRVTLIENETNLGFVESVNRGFDLARERGGHVVLLNSDAFVPPGWASRLLAPIIADGHVATVTPMSNDAEILSVPELGDRRDLSPGQVDLLDTVAAGLNPQVAQAVLPTGVGFCMAVNIDFLQRVPRFDTAFGRGYGEEVDWCQKVRALGGRHLGIGNLFVEHRGGASFGSAEKIQRVAANNAVISGRYPGYDAEVHEFIVSDPLFVPRFVLAVAQVANGGPLPIYLAHSLGGGAESYLRRRIAEDLEARGAAMVLRVGGHWRWQIELHLSGTKPLVAATEDFEHIDMILAPVSARRIVYSCGVGCVDPVEIPACLASLKRGEADEIEVLFHDFFPLSPSYTLLNSDDVFAGVPSMDDPDPAHVFRRRDGSEVPLNAWRAAWGDLIANADCLVVFSRDSAAHVRAAYPESAGAIDIRPHKPMVDLPRLDTPQRPGRVIGVLGNIGRQKGAAVVVNLARTLAKTGHGALVLIGDLDPDFSLPSSAVVHGTFRQKDIPDLVDLYGITDWLIPSIWPETFSFTTHEALATGLPVWCFDLGAQAEAVRAAENGHIVPLSGAMDPAQMLINEMFEEEMRRYG